MKTKISIDFHAPAGAAPGVLGALGGTTPSGYSSVEIVTTDANSTVTEVAQAAAEAFATSFHAPAIIEEVDETPTYTETKEAGQ